MKYLFILIAILFLESCCTCIHDNTGSIFVKLINEIGEDVTDENEYRLSITVNGKEVKKKRRIHSLNCDEIFEEFDFTIGLFWSYPPDTIIAEGIIKMNTSYSGNDCCSKEKRFRCQVLNDEMREIIFSENSNSFVDKDTIVIQI